MVPGSLLAQALADKPGRIETGDTKGQQFQKETLGWGERAAHPTQGRPRIDLGNDHLTEGEKRQREEEGRGCLRLREE